MIKKSTSAIIKFIARLVTSRAFQFLALPLAVLGWFFWTDPSQGADTVLRLQLLSQALLVTGLAYTIGKSLLGKTSSESLYQQAMQGNTAAGLAYIGVCIVRAVALLALLAFFSLQR